MRNVKHEKTHLRTLETIDGLKARISAARLHPEALSGMIGSTRRRRQNFQVPVPRRPRRLKNPESLNAIECERESDAACHGSPCHFEFHEVAKLKTAKLI
jgi:hypothetical protein